MTDHYFTNSPQSEENRKNISFRFLALEETFVSDDGVFSKNTLDYGSRVLLETLLKQSVGGRVLDLGCGIGCIGILLKKSFPAISLTMSDINERAVALAKENSARYHQDNRVVVSDGFAYLTDEFDMVVTNPPIRTGKKVIYELFHQAHDHLAATGKLVLVMRRDQGAESAIRYLNTLFSEVKVLEKAKGYWVICASRR